MADTKESSVGCEANPNDNGVVALDTFGSDSKKTILEPPPTDFQSVPAELDNANIFSQGGKNYRTLSRWDTVLILVTNQVGLGILSLPSVLQTLGIVPGIIAIIGIGCITWYTAYELLQFYRLHPHVVNMVDMATVVGGHVFETIAGVMMLIQLIFYVASAIVTLSVALNALSDHAACTVVFIFVATAFCFLLSIPRTTKFVSRAGIPNAISVISATLVVLISIAVKGPALAPPDWNKEILIVAYPSFRDGLNACLKIMYSYAANVTFVTYMAEMIDPVNDFKFSLTILEIGSMLFYTAVAAVLYCISGQYTVSPALGGAATIPSKIGYGLILPAIVATGISNGHTGCKYIYVLAMRQMDALHQVTDNSVRSWATWMGCNTVFWAVVFILSNAIPVFDSILSITSATTVSWFTYGFSAIFWFHSNWQVLFSNWKKVCLTVANFLLVVMSLFINGAGLWSSVTGLMEIFNSEGSDVRGAFSCGNNV